MSRHSLALTHCQGRAAQLCTLPMREEEQERFVDLEIKVSYLEKTLADLDGVVRGLGAQMELMRRELERLRDAALSTREAEASDANEKPPHY